VIELLNLDSKADKDLGPHTHGVMGSPSLPRTKARPKNLCLHLQNDNFWGSSIRKFQDPSKLTNPDGYYIDR
jgi:hypothetical protein